ncbi:carboxypeptidase B [Penaeus vannamei]|uniref:carboxypeptidase B n=1 Tax=Penaeus vannamei TaxID=6689 RepID=UPI00387F9B46
MTLRGGLTLLVVAAAVLGQSHNHRADPTYSGWNVLEVKALPPFLNLEALGFPSHMDLLSFNTGAGTTLLAVAQERLTQFMQRLTEAGVAFQTKINDLSQLFIRPLTYDVTRSLPRGDLTFDRYMYYQEIESYIEALPSKHRNKVQVDEIGRSVEGRPIYLITINKKTKTRKVDKPVIFIEAGAHAREWVSPASALYLVERLLESPSLLRNAEWRLVPLLNPDGYVYSWHHDRLWRKNRAPSSVPECFGVDLNRNFDFYWGGVQAGRDPCSDLYQGSNPFSEPESRALRKAVSAVKRRTKAYISLHSFGQTFLYPWSYSRAGNNSKSKDLVNLADGMVRKIEAAGGTRYNISSSGVSLLVGGASDDWVASQGVPYVYTMELRDRGETVFHLPEHLIVPTGEDVWTAMKYLGRKLRYRRKNKRN